MKLLLILFLCLNIYAGDIEIKKATIDKIDLMENRVHNSRSELMKLIYSTPEELDTQIYTLKIPPILYTNVGCGGITVDFQEVMDVLLNSMKTIVAQVPQWMAQEMLGIPDLSSPGAILQYSIELMVEGYCYIEVAGLQAFQTASEVPLDLNSRLMNTYEEEDETAYGMSLVNGSTPHNASGQTHDQTPGINVNAVKQSEAEATEQAAKESYSKMTECVKAKKEFIADVLDVKVKKYTPLAEEKKKLFKSACEIIEEKGKKTDLNDKLNIKRKLYSPIYWGSKAPIENLQLNSGLLSFSGQSDSNIIKSKLLKDKVNDFFKNKIKLIKFKNEGNYVRNSELIKMATYILNVLTDCLNNPENTKCKELDLDKNFIIDFSVSPYEIEGIQNILLKKKNICEIFYSYKYFPDKLNYSFRKILEGSDLKKEGNINSKVLLDNYILGQFCSKNFSREIDEAEIYLNKLVENEKKKATEDFALTLTQLKTYRHLQSFFLSNEDNGIQKGEKLLGVCAYYPDKGNTSIYYWTDKGNKFKKGENALQDIEKEFNVEIKNKPTLAPVILGSDNKCDYDIYSDRFKSLYNNYLIGTKKQAQLSEVLSTDDYKEQMIKERANNITKIQKLNGYATDLRVNVLSNILQQYVDRIIIKLKF